MITLNHEGKKAIIVFPSPSNGESFNLVKNFHFDSNATLQIIDNLGVKVREFQISDLEESIQFRQPLQSGVYFLKVLAGDFSTTVRFSVK